MRHRLPMAWGVLRESQLGFIPVSAGDQTLWSAFCGQHGFMLLLRKLHMKTQTRACLALGGGKKKRNHIFFLFNYWFCFFKPSPQTKSLQQIANKKVFYLRVTFTFVSRKIALMNYRETRIQFCQ